MAALRIFVASSTEGLPFAAELRRLLLAELNALDAVDLWTSQFEAGETTIESLEAVSDTADFAVIVVTADDASVSRHSRKAAPRDNVIFEYGLFMGAIGRKRTFVVRDRRADLKMPSDVLGVTTVMFDGETPEAMKPSLGRAAVSLAAQMRDKPRPKWLAAGRAALAANGTFIHEIQGAWWERVRHRDGSAISAFNIVPDPIVGDVSLEGTSYQMDGVPVARWRSDMVKVRPAERSLSYVWRGTHPVEAEANLRFHGYGTMEFEGAGAAAPPNRGGGLFWDVNEANPSQTVAKPVELLRITDQKQLRIMREGSDAERRAVVVKVAQSW